MKNSVALTLAVTAILGGATLAQTDTTTGSGTGTTTTDTTNTGATTTDTTNRDNDPGFPWGLLGLLGLAGLIPRPARVVERTVTTPGGTSRP